MNLVEVHAFVLGAELEPKAERLAVAGREHLLALDFLAGLVGDDGDDRLALRIRRRETSARMTAGADSKLVWLIETWLTPTSLRDSAPTAARPDKSAASPTSRCRPRRSCCRR